RPSPEHIGSNRRTTTTSGSRSTSTDVRPVLSALTRDARMSSRRIECAVTLRVEPALGVAILLVAVASAAPAVIFTDVTQQAGIRFVHNNGAFGKKYLPETLGAGGLFLDADGDGWQDILLVNS